jgi:hypothetical protein
MAVNQIYVVYTLGKPRIKKAHLAAAPLRLCGSQECSALHAPLLVLAQCIGIHMQPNADNMLINSSVQT